MHRTERPVPPLRIARRDAIARVNRGLDYIVHAAVKQRLVYVTACGRRLGLDALVLDDGTPTTCRACCQQIDRATRPAP